jgi:outer membrane lipoprotein-sorting protein
MKNRIKLTLIALLLGSSSTLLLAQKQDAEQLLDRAALAYNQSQGISIEFNTMTQTSNQSGESSTKGTIDMQGERFVMVMPSMHIFFNGTTQWVYMEAADEVNINNPSMEELESINPMLLLQNYDKGYTVTSNKDISKPNGAKVASVKLTPREKGEMQSIEIQLDKQTALPVQMKLFMQNDVQVVVDITNLKLNKKYPDNYFAFKASDYPEVEIIDLR